MGDSRKKHARTGFFRVSALSTEMRADWFKIGQRGPVHELLVMRFGVADARRRFFRGVVLLVILLAPLACRLDADRKVAERVLERYRRTTGAKPLAASYVVRMRLSPDTPGAGTGVAEVAWEPNRFRERTSSVGVTTERGIQSGKAYFTDEDGVTRVASEPVLRELLTRSYFWRRGWLFADRERARLSLGPADPGSLSVQLLPFGGNPLVLSFSRQDGRLLAVRSPGFDLDFSGDRSFRESPRRRPPYRAEIAWAGLPTGALPDASVGGGRGRFAPEAGVVLFDPTPDGGISFLARVNGRPVRLALDARTDGPLAISRAKADELGLSVSRDVYGRSIAADATLEVGALSCPGIHVEVIESAPAGAEGVVGGMLFREAIVDLDPKAHSLGLSDPERWVAPAGFTRILVDDDGNRPVTTLRKKSRTMRLVVGSATGGSDVRIGPGAARRLEVAVPGTLPELRWGILPLAPVSAAPEEVDRSDWGEDGRLGFGFLRRYRAYVDMRHRWIYVREIAP